MARRKLPHYFESHPVTVVSSFPLGEIIQNREASGKIVWQNLLNYRAHIHLSLSNDL